MIVSKLLNSGVMIVETDLEGKIKHVNNAYCSLSGYSRKELLGADFDKLRNYYIPSNFYANIWNKLENNKVWNGTFSNKNKNGAYYWINSTIYRKDENTYVAVASLANRKDIELAKKNIEKFKK
jgi:PAS domain S-box-containing protein